MHVGWLGGWAVPVEYIERLANDCMPSVRHSILYPGREWQVQAEEMHCDIWIGYSLGAHLMMRECFGEAGILICPFERFGKRTEVNYLKRWLKLNTQAAIEDFYKRAGIDIHYAGLPYSIENLEWGLDVLLDSRCSLNKYYTHLSGGQDPIVDYKHNTHVLEHAGHDIRDYMEIIRYGIWKKSGELRRARLCTEGLGAVGA